MHDSPLVLPPLLLAGLLVLSGLAKLRHVEETRSAFAQLRLPSALTRSSAPRVLPWGEIALALALLAVPSPAAVVVAGAALVLFVAYLVVVVRALGFDHPVTCSCFGRLGLGEVTRRTAARNALLVLVALLALWSATEQGSVLGRLVDASTTTWGWLALVVLTVAVVVATFGGTKGVTPAPAAATDEADGADYERQALPFGVVEDESGRTRTLVELASGGAVLLVFVSPGCAPCAAAIEQVPRWDDALGPVAVRAVISLPVDKALAAAPGLAGRVLHDPQATLSRTFGIGTPAAVLLGGDGLLAGGPVTGSEAVSDFVAQVRDELVEAGVVDAAPLSGGR